MSERIGDEPEAESTELDEDLEVDEAQASEVTGGFSRESHRPNFL